MAVASTRLRLAGTIILVTALATILAVVAVRARLDADVENRIHAALEQEGREFGRFLANEPGGGRDLLRSGKRYLRRNILDQGEAIVVEEAGVGVARSVGAPVALDRDARLRDWWRNLGEGRSRRVETVAGEVDMLAVPVSHAGRRTGTFVVANFLAQERAEVDRAFTVVAQVAAGAIVLVGLFAWAIAGHVLRPLRQMTATAREISEEDITRRLPERRGDDEMTTLIRTFNGMLDRLDTALSSRREFLADVGHELRTPLTIMSGNLEQLAAGMVPAESLAETLDLLRDEVARMSRLVDELLLLAQAEQPDFLDSRPVDLGDIAVQIFRRAESFPGPAWRCEPGHGVIRADLERLTQAALNLVTNAARYSPPGGLVTIGTRLRSGWAEIWVADSGPGLPSDVGPQALQRSVRGDDRRRSGLGLGLAIASAVAVAHGGRIELARAEEGGARVALVIPEGGPG